MTLGDLIPSMRASLRSRPTPGVWPDGAAFVCYAGKALLTRAVAFWVTQNGLSLDVCSAGEIAVARSVGFLPERMILHGNAKTPEDLKAALGYRVGRVVVDSLDEIDQLGMLANGQKVLIRVTPGVDGQTHQALTTGVEDQKFGFSRAGGAAAQAARRVLVEPGLRLVGLHCHLGPSPQTQPAHVPDEQGK